MHIRVLTLAASLALTLSACKDKGDGGAAGASEDGGAEDGGGEDGGEDGGEEIDDFSWEFEEIIGIANLDDDDQNGTADWSDIGADGDNDLAAFTLPIAAFYSAGEPTALSLTLSGTTDMIRVWRDDNVLVGPSNDTAEIAAPDDGEDVILWVEFDGMLTEGTLDISQVSGDGSASVPMLSAPLVINHHMQEGEIAMAMSAQGENASFIADFEDSLGDAFFSVGVREYGWDVWIQDELEYASLTAPGGLRMNIVIDSIRSQNGRGLDDFPENNLVEPDTAAVTWGSGGPTSQDSFGNLEVSPPVTVDGVEYPQGRAYWGQINGRGLTNGLATHIRDQQLQDPFTFDISWLCVGHVDEFSTFLPDPAAPKGFWLVVADTQVGYTFLEGLNPNQSLPQFAYDHGYDTIGEILDDDELRALNQDLADDYIEPSIEIFKAELGLDDGDIIRLPSVFERVSGCGGATLSLIPGTVNMTVWPDADGGPTKLLMPDPFLRGNGDGQADDPLIAEVESLLPEHFETLWLDDWDTYHIMMGEVHCGSNARRTPTSTWWEDSRHLLGGE